MKNAFYFVLRALLVLKHLNFCPDFLGMFKKRLDYKINFEFYDVTAWSTMNYNTHIVQYLSN